MTASEVSMTHTNDAPWAVLAHIVDDLQNKVSLKQINTIPALLQALTQTEKLPGISPQELSVVYRDYGQSRCEWVVHEGRVITDSDSVSLAADSQVILDVLNGDIPQSYSITNGAEACRQVGFDGYQSVLIVPMKLDDQKRLGAFIILNKEQSEAYDLATGRILDVLSDRVALLARMIQQRQREEESTKLRRLLSRDSKSFMQESEILLIALKQLKHWYKNDKVYVLIKNPLDISSYYSANDACGIIPKFRETETISPISLSAIKGGDTNLALMTSLDFKYLGSFRNLPSPDFTGVATDAKSWLGATIYHDEGVVLGHIILHNTEASYAYGDEDVRLLSKTCALLGSQLSKLRYKQKDQLIAKFESEKTENKLYEDTFNYLRMSYGIKNLLIYAVNTATQDWGVKFQSDIFTESDQVFRDLAIKVAQKYRSLPKDNERKKQSFEYPENSGDKYLVVPMRTKDEDGDFRVVGCFVIPAQNQGLIATRIIDEISDVLAKRKKELDDDERQKKLNEYIKKVSKLSPEDLTVGESLRSAGEVIAEIMFSANLYFALYDQDEISFPIIYKDGKPWEKVLGSRRKIDPERQGRTEAIILTGKPILIKTLADSKAWYAQPKRQEFAGNPLTSWAGVPIFNDKGVRGVIAVYHPDLEYVYSSKDLEFLETVAGAISTLFSLVELNQAQSVIAQREKSLAEFLHAKDINHSFGNIFTGIRFGLNNTIKDIEKTIQNGDKGHLHYTNALLDKMYNSVNSAITDLKSITDTNTQDIDLPRLAQERLEEVITEYNLQERIEYGIVNKLTLRDAIISNKRSSLSLCLHLLIQNAAEAIEKILDIERDLSLYIHILLYLSDQGLIIEVVDNGAPISPDMRQRIFDINVSSKGEKGGYGLWRAKYICENEINAQLTLIEDEEEKKFRIFIPELVSKKIALVVEDDAVWQSLLKRTLESIGIRVLIAENIKVARLIIEQESVIDMVFLDISLDPKNTNVDGLKLVSVFKHTPIIFLSQYPERAERYRDKAKLLISKNDISSEDELLFLLQQEGIISK